MKNKLLKFLTILLFMLNISANSISISMPDIDLEETVQLTNIPPDFSGEEPDTPIKH